MHQSLYRVVHVDGGWAVLDRAGKRCGDLYQTQGDGVVRAKELALRDGSAQIVVQGPDGRVVSDFMHQREERHSLRRDDSTDDSLFGSAPARRSSPSHA
ncbi:MAG: DUF2188 domain-containing protein [Deltaproteobacteria bacterium]|nr:DUF2188 domain-containing protein [Deltaproteobacteria bacterium]